MATGRRTKKDEGIRYQGFKIEQTASTTVERAAVTRKFKTYDAALNALAKLTVKRDWTVGETSVDRVLEDGWEWVKCNGEAHRPEVAGNIDHCMVCMPFWGEYPARKKVTHLLPDDSIKAHTEADIPNCVYCNFGKPIGKAIGVECCDKTFETAGDAEVHEQAHKPPLSEHLTPGHRCLQNPGCTKPAESLPTKREEFTKPYDLRLFAIGDLKDAEKAIKKLRAAYGMLTRQEQRALRSVRSAIRDLEAQQKKGENWIRRAAIEAKQGA